MTAAALATLAHPRWWALALAGFLVRGGVFLLLVPIVVPPTVAGVMSLFAPTIVGQVLVGGPNTPVLLLAGIIGGALVLFAWIAGTLGSTFDTALVREAIDDEELELDGGRPASTPSGLGTVRLGPHLLTAFVFAVAAARIFQVAYAEATSPVAPTTPFVVRVARQAPVELGALLVVLLLAETVGGLALRAMLLEPDLSAAGLVRALGRAIRDLLRPAGLVTLAGTTLGVMVIGVPGAIAAARAWSQVRLVFAEPAEAWAMAVALLLFVAVVLGWLMLLGVGLAWRSVAWTHLTARTVTQPTATASEASR